MNDADKRSSDEEVAIAQTDRLRLRRIVPDDAAFLLELLNDPSFLANIGDRGVRSLDDARAYIDGGPVASYVRHGFGLYLVELAEPREPIGICGVLRRDGLADPDLGFALLPRHWGRGFALEAAQAVLEHARATLGLRRLVAITLPGNQGSKRLLERIGFRLEGTIRLAGDSEELELYATHFTAE
ncbi:MAG TPA: GNAT family N-acetyltransferase [Thermoanaerobaculia bacterium]|nr:GNAT family N-acetyltransferase [Thermoanaerobaculia bacterium]